MESESIRLVGLLDQVSIRPPVLGPVECSEARKAIPRKVSRCFSMRLWRDFSSAIEGTVSSVTWSKESLRSDMAFLKGVDGKADADVLVESCRKVILSRERFFFAPTH